jgi:hypothetical protein
MAKKFWIAQTIKGLNFKISIVEQVRSPKAAIYGPFETIEEASGFLDGYMKNLIDSVISRSGENSGDR